MKPKDPVWNFYSALDDEKKTIIGAWTVMQKSWTVMQKSVLRS